MTTYYVVWTSETRIQREDLVAYSDDAIISQAGTHPHCEWASAVLIYSRNAPNGPVFHRYTLTEEKFFRNGETLEGWRITKEFGRPSLPNTPRLAVKLPSEDDDED